MSIKRLPYKFIAAMIVALLVGSCKNDVSGPGSDDSNLISNPSFEFNDMPSFEGWHLPDTVDPPATTNLQYFTDDAPLLGGLWSLKVVPDFAPREGFAQHYIVGPADSYVYRLSVWGKAVSGIASGTVQFRLFSSGTNELRQSVAVTANAWQLFTLEDTVRLYDTDTLVVRLSAGSDDGSVGYLLFDEVRLERYK